ncbi:EAL domain-containing response regulator [Herbaspirillum robiniae]|uniref:EAL domain-containing protein n=1 Tax=Herbaspirillum robiniae TaxID=2014887 RepID=A0ABX2LS19_9BURK|nr:EAL domain-containing response regulator [Herbaspirillum robiniae]NUU00906.1 EAL domain-containing protein [Herbaspirillum robiniae]
MKSIADLSILIVEDEPLQRAFLAGKLRQLGAGKIAEACDGAEAIQMMDSRAVDLIFCDIGMPNVDGPQFILRQLEYRGEEYAQRAELPMLVWMSVLGPGILQSHSRLASIAGFSVVEALSKPLSSASLSYVVELAVEKLRRQRRPDSAAKLPPVSDDDLLRAICDTEEFEVWFRPILSLESGKFAGGEAEVRWNHPRFRQLHPAQFTALIERQGLGLVLFYRTVNHVLHMLRKLNAAGQVLSLGIKASAQTLQTPEIADYLAERTRQHQISPDQLCIVLSADAVSTRGVHLSASLNRLRIKGFRLFLDGFGAGAANMETLAEMPFSGICIDHGFVRKMPRHPVSKDIVDVILGMGRKLQLPVVANGVDDGETRDMLRGMGCCLAQGGIAAPLRGQDFLRALRELSVPAAG